MSEQNKDEEREYASGVILLNRTQKNQIRELAQKYSINLEGDGVPHDSFTQTQFEYTKKAIDEIHLDFLNQICLNKNIITSKDIFYHSDSLGLAKYVLTLNKAWNEKLNIEFITEKYPLAKQKEGALFCSKNMCLLWLQADNLLKNQYGELYNSLFKWNRKDKFKLEGFEFFKPYTQDELNLIILYEEKIEKETINNAKRKLKNLLNAIREYYKKEGVFNKSTKEPSSREYQFLHDLLIVLGIFSEDKYDMIAEDKKDILRDFFRNRNRKRNT